MTSPFRRSFAGSFTTATNLAVAPVFTNAGRNCAMGSGSPAPYFGFAFNATAGHSYIIQALFSEDTATSASVRITNTPYSSENANGVCVGVLRGATSESRAPHVNFAQHFNTSGTYYIYIHRNNPLGPNDDGVYAIRVYPAEDYVDTATRYAYMCVVSFKRSKFDFELNNSLFAWVVQLERSLCEGWLPYS